MPKQNKPHKYCKMGKYALIYHQGRKIYLGLYGSPESQAAYTRLLAELQANPTAIPLSNGEKRVTISELAAGFLEYAKNSVNSTDYDHYRTIASPVNPNLVRNRMPFFCNLSSRCPFSIGSNVLMYFEIVLQFIGSFSYWNMPRLSNECRLAGRFVYAVKRVLPLYGGT